MYIDLYGAVLSSEGSTNKSITRYSFMKEYLKQEDSLCGLVVSVPGYRGPGSIPGATRFFLRSSGSGTGAS
jgi:hypothetical protein